MGTIIGKTGVLLDPSEIYYSVITAEDRLQNGLSDLLDIYKHINSPWLLDSINDLQSSIIAIDVLKESIVDIAVGKGHLHDFGGDHV